MAIKFVDGCDSYGATADLAKKWGSVASPWAYGAAFGRTGGGGIQAATTGGVPLRQPNQLALAINSASVVAMGFWIKLSTTPGSVATLLQFEGGGSSWMYIKVDTNGKLSLYSQTISLIVTGGTNICDNAWHWVEIYIQWVGSSSVQKCYVDGVVQWNSTYTPILSGFTLDWPVFYSIASVTMSLDDVIIYDSSGSQMLPASVFPLGPQQISTKRPNGDSAVQFTRSTGSDNYALVDEAGAPDTSDYVESGTSGNQDLYDYEDLGFTPASIKAVVLNGYVANPNPGSINFRQQAKSSATTTDGISTLAPSNPRIIQEPVYLDPNGAAAWTESGFNSAKFGVKVV